jgi:hypothetical protein
VWFATGLRQVLDQLSGGDPLTHATVPTAVTRALVRLIERESGRSKTD